MPWGRIESYAYWSLFLVSFILVAGWESFRPKKDLSSPVERRWSRHGIILVVASVVSVSLCRVTPVLVAVAMMNSRFGLMNKAWLPFPLRFIVSILLLDLVRFAMHWSYHSVSLLWRVHQVHHSDPDFDVSTAGRTHPIEVTLLQVANIAAVAILAAPPAAVLIVELLAATQSFFSHANASLPAWVEKPVRWIFVTSDMHRIHHSEEVPEQSRNFGEIFSVWDRIFSTYLEEPAAGQEHVVVGLKGYQNEKSLNLGFILLQPFLPLREEMAPQETPVLAPSSNGTD